MGVIKMDDAVAKLKDNEDKCHADVLTIPPRIDFSGNRSSKTFKPKKNIPEGTHQYDLMKHAAATLGSGNLRLAVMLPEGEDLNEWVAVNSKLSVQLVLLPFQPCGCRERNANWISHLAKHAPV